MEILLIFVTPCFPKADAISSSVANANSLLLITPLEVVSFLCGYAMHFFVWNVLILNVFCLTPAAHHDKQIAMPRFLNRFQTSACRYYFFLWGGLLCQILTFPQRFNNNESRPVWCLIRRIWFSQVSLNFFFIWRRHICCIFVTSPVLNRLPRRINLGSDADTWPVYSSWG